MLNILWTLIGDIMMIGFGSTDCIWGSTSITAVAYTDWGELQWWLEDYFLEPVVLWLLNLVWDRVFSDGDWRCWNFEFGLQCSFCCSLKPCRSPYSWIGIALTSLSGTCKSSGMVIVSGADAGTDSVHRSMYLSTRSSKSGDCGYVILVSNL